MISERVLQELRDAFDGCQQGDCRYPDPAKAAVDLLRVELPPRCLGRWGTVHLEAGERIVRYSKCPRHAAWWRAEQQRIRDRKAKEKAAAKGEAALAWREHGHS
jgi:hypothetical protein